MSNNQIKNEKMYNLFKISSFVLCQFAIVFFGIMLSLWVIVAMRNNELSNPASEVVKYHRPAAIAFTVLFIIAAGATAALYFLFKHYKAKLDGFVDKSIKTLNKNNDIKKPSNININLNTAAAPIKTPVTPINPNTPVKKVVTQTTTTTSRPGVVTPPKAAIGINKSVAPSIGTKPVTVGPRPLIGSSKPSAPVAKPIAPVSKTVAPVAKPSASKVSPITTKPVTPANKPATVVAKPNASRPTGITPPTSSRPMPTKSTAPSTRPVAPKK